MDSIFVIRGRVQELYASHSRIFDKAVQFIVALAAFYLINDNVGFLSAAASPVATLALSIICTFFPNGQNLRPASFDHQNLFTQLVQIIYATDTPTNVLPSLHVYNSLGAAIAIAHSSRLKKHRAVRTGAYILTTLIILSTVFLKQHSATDVFAAFAIALLVYPLVYVLQEKKVPKLMKQPV